MLVMHVHFCVNGNKLGSNNVYFEAVASMEQLQLQQQQPGSI